MDIGIDFWLQLAVLLACLFYATPVGGMTLGLMGGIGLVIFIFGFGLKPGKPPVDVILLSRLWLWSVLAHLCRLRAVGLLASDR